MWRATPDRTQGGLPLDHQTIRDQTLRLIILEKLADGRLPHDSIPRVWGGPGAWETCNACEEMITHEQWIMEGISTDPQGSVQLHVECFFIWDTERQVLGHAPSGPRRELACRRLPAAVLGSVG